MRTTLTGWQKLISSFVHAARGASFRHIRWICALHRHKSNICCIAAKDLMTEINRMGIFTCHSACLKFGAGEGARTLDPDLGKVVLYH